MNKQLLGVPEAVSPDWKGRPDEVGWYMRRGTGGTYFLAYVPMVLEEEFGFYLAPDASENGRGESLGDMWYGPIPEPKSLELAAATSRRFAGV